jgi:hypothetical protein
MIRILTILLLATSGIRAEDVALREDFDDLKRWQPLTFPSVKAHSRYSTEKEGDTSFLKAETVKSASAIRHGRSFDPAKYPVIRFRWKVSNVYAKGDAATKDGDDYPVRVYVMFAYDPDTASFSEKLKFKAAKSRLGEYPPQGTLNYIWANRDHGKRILTNTYSERSKMVVLQSGETRAGQWVEEEVNIAKDYARAFGGKLPKKAQLAIMADSENTGSMGTAYIDYIEVRSAAQ